MTYLIQDLRFGLRAIEPGFIASWSETRIRETWIESEVIKRRAVVAGLRVDDDAARVSLRGESLANEGSHRQRFRSGDL